MIERDGTGGCCGGRDTRGRQDKLSRREAGDTWETGGSTSSCRRGT